MTRSGNGVVLGGKGRFSGCGKTMERSVWAMGRGIEKGVPMGGRVREE